MIHHDRFYISEHLSAPGIHQMLLFVLHTIATLNCHIAPTFSVIKFPTTLGTSFHSTATCPILWHLKILWWFTVADPVSTVLPAVMEPWPVHQTCYLSQTCCFQLSRDSRSRRETLNDRQWKANWHLLLRCWPVAPSTTNVIFIICPLGHLWISPSSIARRGLATPQSLVSLMVSSLVLAFLGSFS